MDFDLFPQSSLTARIINPLEMHHTRHGSPCVQMMTYIYHYGKSAKMIPLVAFSKTATKLADHVQQGDLLRFSVRVDAIQHHKYLDPFIVVNAFSFLEPESVREMYRGNDAELAKLFPVVPDNFKPEYATAPKDQKAVPEAHAEAETPDDKKKAHAKPASASGGTKKTADWVDDAIKMSKVPFPEMG